MPRIWVPSDTAEKRKMLQDLFSNPHLLPPSLLSYLNDYNALNQANIPASQIVGISGFLERLDQNTDSVVISNSTAETEIYSYDVPGGLLQTKGAIKTEIYCKWLQNGGANSTIRVRFKYGATTMADVTSLTVNVSPDPVAFPFIFMLSNRGASNSQEVVGYTLANRGGTGAGYGAISNGGFTGSLGGTATIDSTLKQTLSVTIELSLANASNTFTKLVAHTTRVAH